MFCDAFENDQLYQNMFTISLFIFKIIKYNFDLYIMHIVPHLHLKMDFWNLNILKKIPTLFWNLKFLSFSQ
jgi:hypothetical protein